MQVIEHASALLSKGAALHGDAGGPARMLGVAVDITERRLGEAMAREKVALHESEAHFRLMADAMPQIVWAARVDGYVDYANRKWHELAGIQERLAGSYAKRSTGRIAT